MKNLVASKQYQKALDLFHSQPQIYTDVSITMAIKACAMLCKYQEGLNIHQKVSSDSLSNPFIQTSLIQFYMKCKDVENAYPVFLKIVNKTNHVYTVMFTGLISNKLSEKVLDLVDGMNIEPDKYTLTMIFSACAYVKNDRAKAIGKKFLRQMSNDFRNDTILIDAAMSMTIRFNDINDMEYIFGLVKKKTIDSYNILMKVYIDNDMDEKAIDLFEQMPFAPDNKTLTLLFKTCAHLSNDRAKQIGKKFLHQVLNNFQENVAVRTSAINMLMTFGDTKDGEQIFELLKRKDIISYNTMINGYVQNNMNEKAIDLFEQMPLNPTDRTLSVLFKACAQSNNDRARHIGNKLIHQMLNKCPDNAIVFASAINMFMNFYQVERAEYLFQLLKEKNDMVYGCMVKGYNINNEPLKSLKLFKEMQQQNIMLNEILSTLFIGACSQIGILSICQSVVDQIPLHLYNKYTYTSLIDMWGKAGSIENAQNIFKLVSNPDIFTYNTMINAYGLNGMGPEAVHLYRQLSDGIRDEITHICVLNACSHYGLLEEARSIFNGINVKTVKIVTTLVDCLSRLFLFDDAQKLIADYEKTNSPCLTMYMAVLSGTRNAHESVLSQKLYDRMKSLFPDYKQDLVSASILLCNTYFSIGNDEQAKIIRTNRIKELGSKVKPGISWTEVDGVVMEFRAHDNKHLQLDEINTELGRISVELDQHGYTYDASWITRPIKDGETVASILCGHSEKLALAYNFVKRPSTKLIQITKNLRICGDCHRATKLIAAIRQCHIIIHDANRIHHFYPNGTCSCQDHF